MDNLCEDYPTLLGDLSSSSDNESPDDREKSLDKLLHTWAIKNITQSDIGKLLEILKRLDPDLPKDPRILLSSRKV